MNNFQQVKIRVTVPTDSAEKVRLALGEAGAGKIGNYIHCTTSYPVTGRFLPQEDANPSVGEVGKMEEVEEVMIEIVCDTIKLEEIIKVLKEVHPYEEPAIDLVPLMNLN